MKLTIAAWMMLPLAYGHTHITNMFVNGVDQVKVKSLLIRINADQDFLG